MLEVEIEMVRELDETDEPQAKQAAAHPQIPVSTSLIRLQWTWDPRLVTQHS